MDGKSPVVCGRVWNWTDGVRVSGLSRIYIKYVQYGIPISPFYVDIAVASRDMGKVIKAFPKGMWQQPIEWVAKQKPLHAWVETHLGKLGDLIGGEWVKEDE